MEIVLCGVCRIRRVRISGRCAACDAYRRRHGHDRSVAEVFQTQRRAGISGEREARLLIELEELDIATDAVFDVLRREHVTVSHGKVIDVDGRPLLDDEPVLRAVATLMRVQERRAKLLGLDAPTKVTQDITVEHTTAADAELERLARQLASRAQEESPVVS